MIFIYICMGVVYQRNLIENRPEPKGGFYKTLDEPGWGIILDKNYIKKYQVL